MLIPTLAPINRHKKKANTEYNVYKWKFKFWLYVRSDIGLKDATCIVCEPPSMNFRDCRSEDASLYHVDNHCRHSDYRFCGMVLSADTMSPLLRLKIVPSMISSALTGARTLGQGSSLPALDFEFIYICKRKNNIALNN